MHIIFIFFILLHESLFYLVVTAECLDNEVFYGCRIYRMNHMINIYNHNTYVYNNLDMNEITTEFKYNFYLFIRIFYRVHSKRICNSLSTLKNQFAQFFVWFNYKYFF